jgi:hypothetical protein
MRFFLRATKIVPHPELVEGRRMHLAANAARPSMHREDTP